MIITCIGHAKFLLELDNGMRLVTDPYDATCGYPVTRTDADVVLISHGHHDHSALDTISGYTQVVDAPGVHTLAPDVRVTAVEAYHDDVQGAKRGKTLMFLIEAEGLRVAHLGDLGCPLTPAWQAALAPVDVLMIPVGGFYTIDAVTAKEVATRLQARVILPMHYRTAANAGWPIAPAEDFTGLYAEPVEELVLLRVTAGDLSCQPHVAVLKPQSLR
ncbi:MAG: MBL fold metallo-hydrolase [Aristaeellaceae bacterium]